MKKKASQHRRHADLDTMRPEYDFTGATRGATVKRYRQGTNVVVVAPDVLDVFPDSTAVNEALRALAPVIRRRRRARGTRRSA
jgi:hypothetical protein